MSSNISFLQSSRRPPLTPKKQQKKKKTTQSTAQIILESEDDDESPPEEPKPKKRKQPKITEKLGAPKTKAAKTSRGASIRSAAEASPEDTSKVASLHIESDNSSPGADETKVTFLQTFDFINSRLFRTNHAFL